ncbi:MAG: hypothetical protein ACRDAX_01195 [Propionibacteriaceae bacterium]
MSRMQAELVAHLGTLPFPIPEELEQAWRWLEQQELGFCESDGYFLALADEVDGVYFDATLELPDLAADVPDSALIPIAEIDDDGTTAFLWLRHGSVCVAALNDVTNEAWVLADTVVDFLRLLAVGYDELSSEDLGTHPTSEDTVKALAKLRTWVESTFATTVPQSWPQLSADNIFADFLDEYLD